VLAPSSAFEGALLDSLAVARTSTERSLSAGLAALRMAASEGDGLIIGVFGRLDAADVHDVARSRQGTATCVAVLVGDEDVTTAKTGSVLRAAGWRVLTISSAASLVSAWAGAGRTEQTKPHMAREHADASDDITPKNVDTGNGNGSAAAGGTDGAGDTGQGAREGSRPSASIRCSSPPAGSAPVSARCSPSVGPGCSRGGTGWRRCCARSSPCSRCSST
jgi:hypothetical protein